jgi:hypothetical protein
VGAGSFTEGRFDEQERGRTKSKADDLMLSKRIREPALYRCRAEGFSNGPGKPSGQAWLPVLKRTGTITRGLTKAKGFGKTYL